MNYITKTIYTSVHTAEPRLTIPETKLTQDEHSDDADDKIDTAGDGMENQSFEQ